MMVTINVSEGISSFFLLILGPLLIALVRGHIYDARPTLITILPVPLQGLHLKNLNNCDFEAGLEMCPLFDNVLTFHSFNVF